MGPLLLACSTNLISVSINIVFQRSVDLLASDDIRLARCVKGRADLIDVRRRSTSANEHADQDQNDEDAESDP